MQRNRGNRIENLAVLGTFTPRRCGIATFTADLTTSLGAADPCLNIEPIAMSDQKYDYPALVCEEIDEQDHLAYGQAADIINRRRYSALSVQHEYGIFGGTAGEYVLSLLRAVDVPIITTLHTVLRNPTPAQRRVMNDVVELSERIVVMSKTAISLLTDLHGVDPRKVDFIPHGIPNIPACAGQRLRAAIGGNGPLLLTFGLLSPDKGIQYVIQALPRLIEQYPDTKYLIVGATHPQVLAFSGESYRKELEQLVRELGVQEHVQFINEFVPLEKLVELLSATDYYVTPYLNPMQITSGTLAYSLGAGKVAISTPYEYAKEVLADHRGILVPFRDSDAIADSILSSFSDEQERTLMGLHAASYGREMRWSRVAELYIDSFERAVHGRRRPIHPAPSLNPRNVPEINLKHLRRLTDDTGLFQHASFSIPNRKEGYCVDDNARALLLTSHLELSQELDQETDALQERYLAFVADAFNEDTGRFRNFMSFNRNWLEETGSEDSQGRCLWALGVFVAASRNAGRAALAARLFRGAAQHLECSNSPRTWAYSVLGSGAFMAAQPGDIAAHRLLVESARKLSHFAQLGPTPTWRWGENRLAYANARIPQAMMVAGSILGRAELVDYGVEALKWLIDQQTGPSGCFSPVGVEGASEAELGLVAFDQQPIEVWSSISACITASRLGGGERFLQRAYWCFDWFLGGNVLRMPLVDLSRGACCDGLGPHGRNENQGAESTLSYLCSLAELRQVSREAATGRRVCELL